MTLVEFECRGHRYALPLRHVCRVVPSARPIPLPGAPDIVLGILNMAGEFVTVIDFPQRIGLPPDDINTEQHLLIADIGGFLIGFIVDRVHGITDVQQRDAEGIPQQLAAAPYVEAVHRTAEGLCIILDPARFLFDEEMTLLGNALEKIGHEPA